MTLIELIIIIVINNHTTLLPMCQPSSILHATICLLSIELNWIEFNTFKRRRLQIDQRRHTTNELNKLINVHNNFEKFIKSKMN